jgi:RimJ/RimL family protein N-acetyltransferase
MFPVLIPTSRLLIRELEAADWRAMHEYASLLEVVRYEPWGPNTEEESREFLLRAVEAQSSPARRSYELGLVLKETGALIGCAGIRPKLDEGMRDADFGYTLHPEAWGQGLATEAARALVAFGFDELNLHRIWATCHVDNCASARVLEKAGLRREGTLRQNRLQRGEWRDSHLYAILETDPRSEA